MLNILSIMKKTVEKGGREMEENQFTAMFASPDERLVSVLGNNIAHTFFATGTIGKGFAVLSDRRVYFKGKCLQRTGKRFSAIHEERVVDVSNVTGTGFVHTKPVWLLVISIVLFVLAAVYFVVSVANLAFIGLLAVLLFGGLGGLFLWLYNSRKRTIFEIAFAGGGIGLDASWIDAQEAEFFQKNIRLVGDNLKRQERQYARGGNAAGELAQLAQLLEKGMITQAEFEEQKRRLLQ